MTVVKIDLRLADEAATLAGRIQVRPIKRLHIHEADDFIMLPAAQTYAVVASVLELTLRPTGVDWCWEIVEKFKGGITRYVIVPDSPTPVEYADLVDVDPDTFDPETPATAAWWAAYDALAAEFDQLHSVPAGGGTGQVLAKASATDFDLQWSDQTGGGGGDVASVNGKTPDPAGNVTLTFSDVGAQPAGSYAPLVHTHTIAQVDGLTAALAGKQPSGSYATTSDLTTGLATKADTVHTHSTADIVSGVIDPARLGLTGTDQFPVRASNGLITPVSLQATGVTANTVPRRTSTGTVRGATATDPADLATKAQLDTGLSLQVTATATANQVYTTDAAGAAQLIPFSMGVTTNTIARRQNNAALKAGTAVANDDLVPKLQFDNGLANKADTSHTHTIAQVTGLQAALDLKPDSVEIDTIKVLTAAAYAALPVKDARTMYYQVG